MLHKKKIKIIFAIMIGLLTMIVINSLASFLIFQRVKGFIAGDSLMDSFIYNRFLLTLVSLLTPIIGGVVVGYQLKEKGWLYAGILGVIIKLFSIFMISTVYFYPQFLYGNPSQEMYYLAHKNLLRQILSLPFAILFIAWGGWIETMIAKKKVISTKHSPQ